MKLCNPLILSAVLMAQPVESFDFLCNVFGIFCSGDIDTSNDQNACDVIAEGCPPSSGPVGPRGLPGPTTKGDRGIKGEQGMPGPAGAPAPAISIVGGKIQLIPGRQGDRGPEGGQGETGLMGPKGEPGDAGRNGKDGAPGPVGPRGPPGDEGPPGVPVVLTNLEGGAGVAGPPGPPGDVGPPGVDGADGAVGAMGPPGQNGRDGNDGRKGETGPRGVEGDQGPKGVSGSNGISIQGDPGPQGDKGPQGASVGVNLRLENIRPVTSGNRRELAEEERVDIVGEAKPVGDGDEFSVMQPSIHTHFIIYAVDFCEENPRAPGCPDDDNGGITFVGGINRRLDDDLPSVEYAGAYTGEIRIYLGEYVAETQDAPSSLPQGWLLCNGQKITAEGDYAALFDLIGEDLPDLTGRAPIGLGDERRAGGRALEYGLTTGAEKITLSLDNLPAHSHTVELKTTIGVEVIEVLARENSEEAPNSIP